MPGPVPTNTLQDAVEGTKIVFEQLAFDGGMNQQVDPTRLQPSEYPLLINGRTRYGVVEPVALPADADPQGTLTGRKIQGFIAAGPYFIVFADGKAFYRDVTMVNAAYNQIPGFQMDRLVDVIYAEAVPASYMNYKRKLTTADDNTSGIHLFDSVAGSPQCVVCQDGVSQPRLIFEDGSTRVANTYEDWTIDNREYIPIGYQMMYLNGVLYVVGDISTGSYKAPKRQIFRSVTGRPLDFVVNIATDGSKGGDASTTSLGVDYDAITCISKLNSNVSGFFVSTAKNSYIAYPDINKELIFAEYQFAYQPLFNTGPINNFSMCDLVGDAAFIDFGGIRSFNAVLQNRNEGRNLPFSKKVALLFATITQTSTASVTFDDYAFFAIDSIYGRAVLVYDTIQSIWIGIDIYDNFQDGEYIQQFCEVKVGTTRRLFCRTSGNRIYELFAGTEVATVKVYLGDWCSNDPMVEQHPQTLKCVFTDVEEAGNVTVTPYIDRLAFEQTSAPLKATTPVFAVPLAVPFGAADKDVVRNVNFGLVNVDNGWKVGFLIQWSFAAQLTHVRCESFKVKATESSDEQAATING